MQRAKKCRFLRNVGTLNLSYLFIVALPRQHFRRQIEDAVNTFAENKEILPSGMKQSIGGKLLDTILRVFAPLM